MRKVTRLANSARLGATLSGPFVDQPRIFIYLETYGQMPDVEKRKKKGNVICEELLNERATVE